MAKRRRNATIYVAGWNSPGYLPESDPVIFDDQTDAIRYLSETIDRFWDEDYDGEEPHDAIDNRWIDLYSSLTYETAPFNILNGDGSLAFWIERHPPE